ncbi:MAG: type II secretion system protein GspN [Desulfosalsimonadaceae bacterium]
MKKWIFYIVFAAAAAAGFLYILFPSEQVRQYIIRRAEQQSPGISVELGRVSPCMPPGLKLENLQLSRSGRLLFESSQLRIIPGYLSLFSARRVFHVSGSACGGSFEGEVAIEEASRPDYGADISFQGIKIEKIAALEELTPHKLYGEAEGSASCSTKGDEFGQGRAEIVVKKSRIDLNTSMFGFKGFAAGTLTAEIEIDGSRALVEEIRIEGKQVSGSASGTIALKLPLQRSRLDLSGSIGLHPAFVKKLGRAVPRKVFPIQEFVEKPISFRISGTAERPEYSLR